MSRRLFLIDTYGFVFRAYYARARTNAPPMRTASGQPTEAVFIFHNMLRKLVQTQSPDYVAAVFESSGPTFRDEAFAEYKANRAEMPDDLRPQIDSIRRLLDAMRIPILQFPGYEADDVIGTLAKRAAADGFDVVIVSSDKDMLQLVGERVRMLNPMKPDPPADFTLYDRAKTEDYMGVPPEHVADLLALKGDAIDNIPGAPGIGDKGARDLVKQYGPVEQVLAHAAEVSRKTYRESLLNHREQVELSKRLATIDTAVPIVWDVESAPVAPPDRTALEAIYRELEFFSFLRDLAPEAEALSAPVEVREIDSLAGIAGPIAVAANGHLGLSIEAGKALRAPRDLPLEGHRLLVHDWKSAPSLLAHTDVFDAMLAGFLIHAEPAAATLDGLAERHLRRRPGASPEERAEAIGELARLLEPELDRLGLRPVYDRIDLPLVPVLARMEAEGVRVDPARLQTMGAEMDAELTTLSERIFAMTGHPFNINSPQQLGKVLFDELQLPPPGGRPKTKAPSTAADVLEALAVEHPIAQLVLDYRQVAKLKGTYADALGGLIRPETGRIHTTYNQCGAATGRLSSTNPNLQNIPIRTETGRAIRAAFVPREGWRFVVADYSQIELRLLAHMSGDKVLVEAFRNGEDIHTRTAAEVFGVPPLLITPEQRRNAKAVNFGIVYGQTPFGLSQALGIPRAEAELYIRSYFERYAGVRRFIDETIAKVRKEGYAYTLAGRRRPIPDMLSRNPAARGFAERTAVNTPLQGTAADLIKLAMITIDRRLRDEGWQAKMLLQVHDELVFEAPPEEAPLLAKMVKREMEIVEHLKVPLVVDTGIGDNWRDAK